MRRLLLLLIPFLFIVTCSEPVADTFGNIAGTVTDSRSHSPLAGVSIKLSPIGNSQVTGNNGTFQFDNLDVQEYTLSFSKHGYHSHEEKVSVKPGLSSTIQVSLEPMASITGLVLDANTQSLLSGVSVKLSPGGSSLITGNDGTFRFDNLDPQEYALTFTRTGYVSKEERITVRSGQTSTIQVMMTESSVNIPTLMMKNPSNLTKTSVRLHASLTSTGGAQVTQHGFCYGMNHNPTTLDNISSLGIASNVGDYSADISGLSAGTTYYVRAYAQNSAGIAYSDEITITTLSEGNGGDNGGSNGDDNGGDNGGNNDDVDNTDSIAVSGGLKLYYTFDNGDCIDATEYENDGVPVNNPSYITDTSNGSGKAIFLKGDKGQYINIVGNLFSGLRNYSMSFWIKDFSGGSIISGITSGQWSADQWPKLIINSNNRFSFDALGHWYEDTETFFSSYSYSEIQSSGWHHIVLSYIDNSGDAIEGVAYFYVDGTLVDNQSVYWGDPTGVTKVQIGGNGNGTFPVSTSMKIDNVRIYNKGLTKDEVIQIYNSEK